MTKHIIKRKIFNLQFPENPDLEGASIRVRSTSLGQLLGVADQAERARAGVGLDEVNELLDLFAERLDSWNLADEDETEIPGTVDGLKSLDVDVALAIVLAWFDAMTAVTGPLEKRLTSGQQSPEESVPTALL